MNNGCVLSVWVGRRGVAILASVMLLVGSIVPAAHVHFTVSPSGWLEPVQAHQHLQPHRLAIAGHAAFHADDDHHATTLDDDDDGLLTQSLEQQSARRDAGVHLPILVACSLASFIAPPRVPRPQSHDSSAFVVPPNPSLTPHGLRAPPAVV